MTKPLKGHCEIIMNNGSLLYEIDSIDKELARLRKKIRDLGKRKKELTANVIENLKESGEVSVTHNGKTYVLEERGRHCRKSDKKKKHDAILVLQEEGFHGAEAEEIYDKITEALKGPEQTTFVLK